MKPTLMLASIKKVSSVVHKPKRSGLIISIEEARKILGDSAKNMSDEDLEHTIVTLHAIARESLADAAKKFSARKDRSTSK